MKGVRDDNYIAHILSASDHLRYDAVNYFLGDTHSFNNQRE
jgi:hypothetical protein